MSKDFKFLHGLLSNKNMKISMEFFFGDYPSKKADFGRTKAEMGCFSQKGLSYIFEILHGLLTHKNNRIPMGKKLRGPPRPPPPQKADFGREKAKMGPFSQKGLCYNFEIFIGQFWAYKSGLS